MRHVALCCRARQVGCWLRWFARPREPRHPTWLLCGPASTIRRRLPRHDAVVVETTRTCVEEPIDETIPESAAQ